MTPALEAVACCAPLAAPTLTDDEAEATAELFKTLGDPARVRIVNMLATSDEPVDPLDLRLGHAVQVTERR